MKTSVVIPVWNGLEFLKENLPAVVALGANEIIIVDDYSPDTSSEFVSQEYPTIKIVRNARNMRFPQAVNNGFAAATGDIIILLNQDVTPKHNLLKSALPHFDDPKMFAVTFNEGRRSWAQAEFKKGFIEFKNGKADNKPHASFWASGGSAAYRKSMWDELGGFDPGYTPGYFEDMDIGFRARKRGYEIIWDPSAQVDHEVESTISNVIEPRRLRHAKERNYLLTHWKNLSWKNIVIHKVYLLKRLILAPGYLLPVLMAAVQLPQVLLFRIRELGSRRVSDERIFEKVS